MSPDWWRDCRDGIEKCSSPTGDGNITSRMYNARTHKLRNVVPRQGTEICAKRHSLTISAFGLLRNVVPRQGTEIRNIQSVKVRAVPLRNVVPRQGTEITLPANILKVAVFD